jgi:methylated-DNA-protein-cysteine methyltransferase related protein
VPADPTDAVPADLPPGGHPEPPDELTDFQRAVVEVVRDLRPGEVVTYAEVALETGHPGSAQAVANVLRRVPGLPWWRVVPSTGRIYRTHAPTQIPLLRAEGVHVDDHRRIPRVR